MVVGIGTIGSKVIRLLKRLPYSKHPYFSNIEEIIIAKQNAYEFDVGKVSRYLTNNSGVSPKVTFAVPDNKVEEFCAIGLVPTYKFSEAVAAADIIIDASSSGEKNKKQYYDSYIPGEKIFLFGGDGYDKEVQCGDIFISGINESAILSLLRNKEQCFVVGSCNSHALGRIALLQHKAFSGFRPQELERVVIIDRRADDPNKTKRKTSFEFSTHDDNYEDEGSYHAYNVISAFESVGLSGLSIITDPATMPDPYMHCTRMLVRFPRPIPDAVELFCNALCEDPFCAVTGNTEAGKLFFETKELDETYGFSQDWLYKIGKNCIYSHAVICLPTMGSWQNGKWLRFGYFTPQDTNVVLATLEMFCMACDPEQFSVDEFWRLLAPLLEPKGI